MVAMQKEWKKEWKLSVDICTILSAVSVVVGLLNKVLGLSEGECAEGVVSGLIWICMVIFLVSVVFAWIVRGESVRVYSDRKKAPKKIIDTNERLKFITKEKLHLTVIGRTNISWFEDKKTKNELYKQALEAGCKITFVIQHELMEVTGVADGSRAAVRAEEQEKTIRAFKEVVEYLKGEQVDDINEKFRLLFTWKPVENSITALFKGEKFVFFSYDIGSSNENNPYLVFEKDSVIPELRVKFKEIQKDHLPFFDYEERREAGIKEITDLIAKQGDFSRQRGNDNRKLVHHYFERRKVCGKGKDGFYPPVSAQVLITSGCSTSCAMCDHYSVGTDDDLKRSDFENIIDYLEDMGTKNIVISGGEPLSKPDDCLSIIEYAKAKNFNIGLLTNGVKSGGCSITAEDADRIKSSCAWVQMSIDSFVEETYKKIRGCRLGIALESAANLKLSGVDLEVAYSIQKLNIDEATELVLRGEPPTRLSNTKIRFKFAHGLNSKEGFLLSKEDVSKLSQFVGSCGVSEYYNTEYIKKLFVDGIFTFGNVAKGTPLMVRGGVFGGQERVVCHVLNYSFKIDAKGNVYPCCYLYDPNNGPDSELRRDYTLGSLRGVVGVPPLASGENKLKELLIDGLGTLRKNAIPIHEKACSCCTRHFCQNIFVNKLHSIVNKKEYKNVNLWDDSYCNGLDCGRLIL